MTFIEEFKKNGYFYQCTNIEALEKKMAQENLNQTLLWENLKISLFSTTTLSSGTKIRPTSVSLPMFRDMIIEGYSEVKSSSNM